MKHVLEFDSIQLSFGSRVILSDIFMKCETGKIAGLLGRNGQGKSCLLNSVYGELDTERSVRFDAVAVVHPFKRPGQLRYLPQSNYLPKSLRLKRVFDDFDLDFQEFEKRFPEFRSRHNSPLRALSGGERRFVETYVILRSQTQFVLLDEPFTHLMPLQIEKMVELMVAEKENKGLLITDHLYQHIIDISDSLYVLADGKTHLIKDVRQIEELGYAKF
jgi:lipopolysaccharide export system ATP-binding protein